jgi:small subunit ribosomal protein S16
LEIAARFPLSHRRNNNKSSSSLRFSLTHFNPARGIRCDRAIPSLKRCCRKAPRHATMKKFRRIELVLTIRLSRIGKKKKPFYRVVVIERTRPRDGRIKEAVGTYDPLKKPAEIKLDAERIKHWIGLGAQPSDTVRSFLRQQKIA